MWRDIRLVAWKERLQTMANKEIMIGVVILPVIYGIMFPLTAPMLSPDKNPALPLLLMLVAALISSIETVYAFAGEREANTLPTLLTTRLSDSALVLGKSLFAVTLGAISYISTIPIYIISYNLLARPAGSPIFIFQDNLPLLLVYLLMPMAFCLFSTSIGMLISTKIKNTKMGAGLSTLPELPFIGLVAWVIFGNPLNIPLMLSYTIIGGGLAILGIAIFLATIGMFSREKMVLR